MTKSLRFRPDIPDGMRKLAGDQEVAGIQYRLPNVKAFAKGRRQELRFEPDPGNPHDPNAIKVIGIYKGWFFTHSVHIGYISASVAQMIAERGLVSNILPR